MRDYDLAIVGLAESRLLVDCPTRGLAMHKARKPDSFSGINCADQALHLGRNDLRELGLALTAAASA
jgi:hypothetical protein